MTYTINVTGHSDSEEAERDIHAKAVAFVAELEGVSSAQFSGTYSGGSIMPDLPPEAPPKGPREMPVDTVTGLPSSEPVTPETEAEQAP